MDFFDGKNAARVMSEYIEREVQGFRKTAESDEGIGGASPEARAAFDRKPYYGINFVGLSFKQRPVVRQGAVG